MSAESEAFSVPSPPEVGQPRTPTTAVVTFLSEADVSSDAARIEASAEAWAASSSGLSTKRCEALQVIELVLSSLALTCWTAMCVLDLSGYWNEPLESEDSLPSHVLSLSVWCVSCGVFIARQSSICCQKDWSKDLKGQAVAGHSGLYRELLVLLATQWSLISGALAWLVFHAAHQRRMQVIAGLLAVLALLALLLCTVVYVLREHRKRSKVSWGAPSPNPKAEARPAKHEDFKRTDGAIRAQAPEAVELSSMTSSVVLADLNRLSFKSHRSSARSSGTHDQEDSLSTSGNYLGKLWSDDGSVSKQSVLKQGVDSMDSDMFSVEGLMSDKSLKQVVFGEMPIRSSRGRWRPLFPSLSESSYSPSASMSCSVASLPVPAAKESPSRCSLLDPFACEASVRKLGGDLSFTRVFGSWSAGSLQIIEFQQLTT
ncbi:unnamed protein product [Symbiodinium sp. CCMP2592]|nr:unnamed protein product [Symbiodinium sp. CCMP2592]